MKGNRDKNLEEGKLESEEGIRDEGKKRREKT